MLKNIFYYEDFGGRHSVNSWRGQRIKNILLLFAGKTDTTKYTWDIKIEIIKSEYTGKLYPRINPIITYSNGLVCSLSYLAGFSVINKDDGIVNNDGSFRFINPKDLQVTVVYKGEEKNIIVKYKDVEEVMKR